MSNNSVKTYLTNKKVLTAAQRLAQLPNDPEIMGSIPMATTLVQL